MENNKIKNLIMTGKFQETEKVLSTDHIDADRLEDIIFDIAFNEKNICAYGFICFLLSKNEKIKYHLIASKIMEIEFCYLDGAYQVALYHIRRAIELAPEDIDYNEMILYFNNIPGVVLAIGEAEEAAQKLLAKDPTNKHALNFLQKKS